MENRKSNSSSSPFAKQMLWGEKLCKLTGALILSFSKKGTSPKSTCAHTLTHLDGQTVTIFQKPHVLQIILFLSLLFPPNLSYFSLGTKTFSFLLLSEHIGLNLGLIYTICNLYGDAQGVNQYSFELPFGSKP